MTEFGVTTETTAKWVEIGVTPEGADTLGLQVLGRRRGGVGHRPGAGSQRGAR